MPGNTEDIHLIYSLSFLGENSSANLSKQIRDEGVHMLVAVWHTKRLIAPLHVDTGLIEQTVKYLKSRIETLNYRERIGSLIMDEIYVAKSCKYSRSNGRIYSMEENAPTTTLLTIMFKSVAANYKDVIVMVTLRKIDSGKIDNLFVSCLETIIPHG